MCKMGLWEKIKKIEKKFGGSKIIATFAVPFETNGIFYGLLATKKVL